MDLGLKDRVYVVTGATRGLGNAAARELVADGAKVIITGRDEKTVAEAAAALGPGVVGVAADNSDPEIAERLVAAAREHFGRFDGILVSVGGPAPGFVADNTDEQWRAAFDSVFLGAVRLARTAVAELEAGGVIGFVLSGSVHEPIPGCVPGWPGSPSPSRTRWGRAGFGWWGCCRRVSTRIACASWTGCPRILRRLGPPSKRGFRCGGMGGRRSSGVRRRFCCRLRRAI